MAAGKGYLYSLRRNRRRREHQRHNRHTNFSSTARGFGSVLLMPLVLVRALGRRTVRWLVLRQERFMHTHSRSSADTEESLRNFNIEAEKFYAVQASPQIRLPFHLRPKPLGAVRKVYIPRRRLSTRRKQSFLMAHYQIPRKGRPVPVSPEALKTLSLRGFVSSSLPKTFQKTRRESLRSDYLCFSNNVNLNDERVESSLKPRAVAELHSLSTESNSSASNLSSLASCDSNQTILNASKPHNALTKEQFLSSNLGDIDSPQFDVASDKVSPRLLQVVQSLRAKASTAPLHPLPFTVRHKSVPSQRKSLPYLLSSTEKHLTDNQPIFNELRLQRFKQNNLDQVSTLERKLDRRSLRNIVSSLTNEPHCSNVVSSLINEPHCSNVVSSLANDTSRIESHHSHVVSNTQSNLSFFQRKDTLIRPTEIENFMKTECDYKSYDKSLVQLTKSTASDDDNPSDLIEPFYDTILDSGYSTVAETSRESMLEQNFIGQYLIFTNNEPTKQTTSSSYNDDVMDNLSRSLDSVGIISGLSNESNTFSHYVFCNQQKLETFPDKNSRSMSAEELSIYSSIRISSTSSNENDSVPLYLEFSDVVNPPDQSNVNRSPPTSNTSNHECHPTPTRIDFPANSNSRYSFSKQNCESIEDLLDGTQPQKSFLHSAMRVKAMKPSVSRMLPAVPKHDLAMLQHSLVPEVSAAIRQKENCISSPSLIQAMQTEFTGVPEPNSKLARPSFSNSTCTLKSIRTASSSPSPSSTATPCTPVHEHKNSISRHFRRYRSKSLKEESANSSLSLAHATFFINISDTSSSEELSENSMAFEKCPIQNKINDGKLQKLFIR